MNLDLHATDHEQSECPVCFGPHNAEIHEASLSVRSWFRADVLRRMEQPPDLVASAAWSPLAEHAALDRYGQYFVSV